MDSLEQQKAKLKPSTRKELEKYSEDDQKRWIANPRMQSFLQSFNDSLLSGIISSKTNIPSEDKGVNDTVPSDPVEEDPDSDTSDSSNENLFSLFD